MAFIVAEFGFFHLVRPTADMTVETAVEDRRELEALFNKKGIFDLVLDLSKIKRVDSAGMGSIMAASATGRGRGHRMLLYAPTPQILELMRILELAGFFPLITSEADLLSRLPD
ncbi:MAG: STAS domain-containing protein [Bilophila sp.]